MTASTRARSSATTGSGDLGLIPNEYLYYYYFNRDAVRSIVEAPLTRGEFLAEQQSTFFERVARSSGSESLALWRQTVANRSASYMAEAKKTSPGHEPAPADPEDQGYAQVAIDVMTAISRNRPTTMILNVRNGTTIGALPPEAVVRRFRQLRGDVRPSHDGRVVDDGRPVDDDHHATATAAAPTSSSPR